MNKTPDQILELALEKERAAYNFYNEAVSGSKIEMIRELLEELRNEEAKHIKLIEKKLAEMQL